MISELKKNIKSRGLNAKVMLLDINRKFVMQKYDIVCGFHVLHHLADIETSFHAINSMLNKNEPTS
jgi:2-polyprenyl-3-methyl-5-hydroxy-6-metoxy-1,4-benzoquinol methylase